MEKREAGGGGTTHNTRMAGGLDSASVSFSVDRKESTLVEHFPRAREIYIHEVVLRTTLQSEFVITTFTSEEIGTQVQVTSLRPHNQ